MRRKLSAQVKKIIDEIASGTEVAAEFNRLRWLKLKSPF